MPATLIDLLCEKVSSHPNKILYTYLTEGIRVQEQVTYQALDLKAKAIAATLQAISSPGDRALLFYPSGLAYIAAFLGCLYAGVVAVPVYPPSRNKPDRRLQAIIQDAGATLILSDTDIFTERDRRLVHTPVLESLRWLTTDDIELERATAWQRPTLDKNTLAFLQYTSGSTSSPKGVVLSHCNLLHNLSMVYHAYEHTNESSVVSWLPPYHDMGLIGGILQSLYGGMTTYLMSPVNFLQQPFHWLKAISHFKATTSGAPNFAYDLCVRKITQEQSETLNLSSWDLAFTGAEPICHQTLQNFQQRFSSQGFRAEAFYPCYGLAEATLFVAGGMKKELPIVAAVDSEAFEQNRIERNPRWSNKTHKIVSSGRAILDQRILIVDPETFNTYADNKIGEIWISSPSIAMGYWNREEETKATFNAYTTDAGRGPFLRTGDLGFINDGELFITGRLKDLIIIRGLNHYPQDIERTVAQCHPALQANGGAVFSICIADEDQIVIVQEIQRSFMRKCNLEEIITAIRQGVSEEHRLRIYAIVLLKIGGVLKTSSGKVQRSACKKSFLDKSLKTITEWVNPYYAKKYKDKKGSGSPLPHKLQTQCLFNEEVQSWLRYRLAEQLQVKMADIDVHTPFSCYGIDSSVAVSLSCELGKHLNHRFETTLFWDYPTIAALSEHVLKTCKPIQPIAVNS